MLQSSYRNLLLVLVTTAMATAGPLAAESKPRLGISIPFDLLAGTDSTLTLTCDTKADSDTSEMIAALQKQGRKGVWSHRDGDDRVEASRRKDAFRMTAWEDGEKVLDLEMPWVVAECLFGGRGGEELRISVEKLREGGGFGLRLEGDRGKVDVTVD